jgi:uncharacterized small protein (DUF1192 family)
MAKDLSAQTVPYERFQEVVHARREAEARIAELEADVDRLKAEHEQRQQTANVELADLRSAYTEISARAAAAEVRADETMRRQWIADAARQGRTAGWRFITLSPWHAAGLMTTSTSSRSASATTPGAANYCLQARLAHPVGRSPRPQTFPVSAL